MDKRKLEVKHNDPILVDILYSISLFNVSNSMIREIILTSLYQSHHSIIIILLGNTRKFCAKTQRDGHVIGKQLMAEKMLLRCYLLQVSLVTLLLRFCYCLFLIVTDSLVSVSVPLWLCFNLFLLVRQCFALLSDD